MKKLIAAALLALGLSACTNEKCQLHMNAFMGTVSNENCTNTQIRLH